jgi:hypothetical protein
MFRRLVVSARWPVLLLLAAASTGFASAARPRAVPLRRAVTTPQGVRLSPGDRLREVADAPASPVLGVTVPSGTLGGMFPGIAARAGRDATPAVADTGKLVVSPALGPQGPTGGIIPSAQPGWQPTGDR